MVGKRKYRGFGAKNVRLLHRAADERLVANMHAVEHAESNDGGGELFHTIGTFQLKTVRQRE
ncbi:hypothetical protein SDC9_80748 [bioreactor metagenome]|uniref:Uncharacterized protein n=1 Tax=bioreactor metagenome TaxID=1076179 RepID=A0A644Z015_9ZZZZ